MASVFYFVGLVFAAIAAFFIYRAEQIDVVVMGDVANLHLMHIQDGVLSVGIGAGIIAAIFIVAGGIVQVMRPKP